MSSVSARSWSPLDNAASTSSCSTVAWTLRLTTSPRRRTRIPYYRDLRVWAVLHPPLDLATLGVHRDSRTSVHPPSRRRDMTRATLPSPPPRLVGPLPRASPWAPRTQPDCTSSDHPTSGKPIACPSGSTPRASHQGTSSESPACHRSVSDRRSCHSLYLARPPQARWRAWDRDTPPHSPAHSTSDTLQYFSPSLTPPLL